MVNHYKNYSLVLQQDQSDCGVACLLSVIKYYGGNSTSENIRKLSGTNITGTTLLGLYQAASSLGFKAEGCEADMATLFKHPSPVILHVLMYQPPINWTNLEKQFDCFVCSDSQI